MKVVFDTNVFVSAFTLPGGQGDQALQRVISGRDSLAISKPIIDEFVGVLSRKFARDREELARAAVFLANLGRLVLPGERIDALADEPDHRTLECAVEAEADLVVTGDRAMLSLGVYRHIRIISLREYLN